MYLDGPVLDHACQLLQLHTEEVEGSCWRVVSSLRHLLQHQRQAGELALTVRGIIIMDSSATVNYDENENITWSILIQWIRVILSGDNLT